MNDFEIKNEDQKNLGAALVSYPPFSPTILNNDVSLLRSLVMTIRKRQLRFVGHVERKGGLEKLVLEGKIKGKRQRGRKRLDFMEGLALAAGRSAVTVLQQTGDRVGFKNMVANVRP